MNAVTAIVSVGGLALVGTWVWNSGGTRLRASSPRICSRATQPSSSIRLIQLWRISRLAALCQRT